MASCFESRNCTHSVAAYVVVLGQAMLEEHAILAAPLPSDLLLDLVGAWMWLSGLV